MISWAKSSFCQSGECAEKAEDSGEVLLRSSVIPDVVAKFSPQAWNDLMDAVRAGEFDDLTEGTEGTE
jgi:Domain of unknown function (DUF397)